MNKKRAYQIEVLNADLAPMIVRKLSEVEHGLDSFMIGMGDEMDDYLDDVGCVYTVTIVAMTDEEIEALPEWDGP
jgi:hypothetical protein